MWRVRSLWKVTVWSGIPINKEGDRDELEMTWAEGKAFISMFLIEEKLENVHRSYREGRREVKLKI